MRLGLFAQAFALEPSLPAEERRAMGGDLFALDIRYGIVDRITLRVPESFFRLDKSLAATDPLTSGFFAGKVLDAEDKRRPTDRLSSLAPHSAAIPYNSEDRQSSVSLALAHGWRRQGDEMPRRAIGSDRLKRHWGAQTIAGGDGMDASPATRHSIRTNWCAGCRPR